MSDPQAWPVISKALIDKVLTLWPVKPYDVKKSHNENVQYSGMSLVALRIKQEYDKQQNSGPVPPPLS